MHQAYISLIIIFFGSAWQLTEVSHQVVKTIAMTAIGTSAGGSGAAVGRQQAGHPAGRRPQVCHSLPSSAAKASSAGNLPTLSGPAQVGEQCGALLCRHPHRKAPCLQGEPLQSKFQPWVWQPAGKSDSTSMIYGICSATPLQLVQVGSRSNA